MSLKAIPPTNWRTSSRCSKNTHVQKHLHICSTNRKDEKQLPKYTEHHALVGHPMGPPSSNRLARLIIQDIPIVTAATMIVLSSCRLQLKQSAMKTIASESLGTNNVNDNDDEYI